MAAAALSTTASLLTMLVPKLHGQSVLPTTFVNSRNQHLPVSSEVAIILAGIREPCARGGLLTAGAAWVQGWHRA